MEKSTNANNYEQQKLRGIQRKVDAINQKGGKCEYCGYNKNIAALDFHHINPEEKDFSISHKGHTKSWESVKKELDKCILLCANCHREIHEK